jgi:hypothetical protein
MADCWICGSPADSAKHMVKASDFRSVFGRVSQAAPAYKHSSDAKNIPVRGAKAEILKFAPSLCSYCNNSRTQPYDRAWEKLSEAMRFHKPALVARSRVPVARIFEGSVDQSMLNVHLYFTKLLGCYAVEHKVPLPLDYFAYCLREGMAPENLRLIFAHIRGDADGHPIIVGNVEALQMGGRAVSARWFYIVGGIGVEVSFAEPGRPRLTRDRGWHPSDGHTRIRMAR